MTQYKQETTDAIVGKLRAENISALQMSPTVIELALNGCVMSKHLKDYAKDHYHLIVKAMYQSEFRPIPKGWSHAG